MTEPVRLAKRVVALTGCSRREAELYIEGGWVRVDGETVDEPQFMVAGQQVSLDPGAVPVPVEPATLVLHKPAGMTMAAARALIGAATRAPDDPSGVRLLKRHFARLEAPLPLPDEASGLVVFTQDWRVKRRLTEDADRIEQECVVDVAGTLAPDGLDRLGHGLRFGSYALPPIKASWQSEQRLRFAMKRVQPDQLARICAAVGLQAQAIRRIRLGRVPMARLAPGQWRYLGPHERI
ncbi:RNA-binding protein [Frateuria sp. Soil773]|uniref:rRNA pseudouridine synthase n=1 Tax=Frateuria sp. Soil773 TaxID=1736407 RepID=UPI0006F3827E|nr:rRNA pseudouridine synthase [Frateuria sp. Soil773]KRE89394.1 RNA-binding protein [Frateuria sp. Soil773]